MAILKGREKDEIIVCAGALGSQQLLVLSCIGPKEQLDTYNIKVVLEQPFIGKGMADNQQNSIFIPSRIPVEASIFQVVGITSFCSYIEEAGSLNLIFANPSAYQGFSPQDTIRSIWHYHGGCHIGKVGPDYKVFGVASLRVIDGSTLLNSPRTNPQASLLMLGRYMGVTVLGQRLASSNTNNK
ncbi:protein HOTHEAD-like [Bidens hawaiensis]|uniref:protein HOTHEAD-like n=1 Tax=Bidens hawaiensis TaxID=980011 RepID=UPI00404AB0BF